MDSNNPNYENWQNPTYPTNSSSQENPSSRNYHQIQPPNKNLNNNQNPSSTNCPQMDHFFSTPQFQAMVQTYLAQNPNYQNYQQIFPQTQYPPTLVPSCPNSQHMDHSPTTSGDGSSNRSQVKEVIPTQEIIANDDEVQGDSSR